MHRLSLLAVLLFAAAPAVAQTSAQTGLWYEGSGGIGLGGAPLQSSWTTRGGLGLWWGNYDDRLALGRSWGVGAAVRYEPGRGVPRIAPSVELRRQIDLLVIGLRWRVQAGPEWHGATLGAGARVGGTLVVRPRPWLGPMIDVEAGASYIAGRVRPAVALSVGLTGAFRLSDRRRRREASDVQDRHGGPAGTDPAGTDPAGTEPAPTPPPSDDLVPEPNP